MQPLVQPPSNTPVTLAQMLARREARVAGQEALLARFGRPVVSLTLVCPGPVKDTPEARFVFEAGMAAIAAALAHAGQPVLASEHALRVTGPEALYAVDADPLALKRALVPIEERHPLGRLWDADVIAPGAGAVSRQQLALPPRCCLVCAQPAHACARSGAHALAELQRAIKDRIDAYRHRTPA